MAFGQKIYKTYNESTTVNSVAIINSARGLSISGTVIAERVGNSYSIKVYNLRKKDDKAWVESRIDFCNRNF
jgi:hypothetical protein